MKNIILLFFLLNSFSLCALLRQQDESRPLNSCKVKKNNIDSLYFNREDLLKYKEAYNYILSDSINQGKDIFVSDMIVDMDRFYFKSNVENDSILSDIINSLTKYYWFDEFSSREIKELFRKQNKNAESVLFFSLIEENTLRADLFFNRKNKKEFRYNWLSNYNVEEVYAYLFYFDETGKIKKVYRTTVIYEI